MEAASADAKSFQEKKEDTSLHHFKANDRCKHCGRKNHESSKCHFKSAKCHNCGKLGHIATICRAPKKHNAKGDHKHGGGNSKQQQRRNPEGEHFITPNCDNVPEHQEESLGLFAVESARGNSTKPDSSTCNRRREENLHGSRHGCRSFNYSVIDMDILLFRSYTTEL